MRLLIIEDNQELLLTLAEDLSQFYAVDTATKGKTGMYMAEIHSYDLILLDIGLPDMDGITVCKYLREKEVSTPILMLTGHTMLDEKVAALDGGADDYVTKPFQLPELHARLRALLRRPAESLENTQLTYGPLQLDLLTRTVYRTGKKIELRRKELDLLELLMRNQGKVVTRSMILEHVWNSNVNSFTNAIDVHMKHLRDQVERPYGSKMIQTVYGAGYRLGTPQKSNRSAPFKKAVPVKKGGGTYGTSHGAAAH